MQNKLQIEINCKTVKSFKKNTGKYRKNEKKNYKKRYGPPILEKQIPNLRNLNI